MNLLIVALLCGQFWNPDQRLTNDTFVSLTSHFGSTRQIVAAGAVANLAWFDDRFGGAGEEETYSVRSTDNGSSWSPELMLSSADVRWSYLPSLSGDGDSLAAAWVDFRGNPGQFEVFYRTSTDGGATWRVIDTASVSGTNVQNCAVLADGPRLHVAWQGFVDTQLASWIIYRRSTDFGATWDDTFNLRPINANQEYRSCGSPALAASGSDVYCAWYERRRPTRNGAHWLRRSTDGGATWQAEMRVTSDAARLEDKTSISTLGTASPSVAARDSVVVVVWADDRDGNWEVYLRRSLDRCATWGPETRLTNAADTSCFPNIALAGDDIHLVFSDRRDGNYEIYYKRSTDLGATWGADVRLTQSGGGSSRPSAAVGDSSVHVVWSDERDGNWEIYYKRGDLYGTGIEEGRRPLSLQQVATLVRGTLVLRAPTGAGDLSLLAVTGRKVLDLRPGANDVSRLAPGVYFVREAQAQAQAVRRVIIAR